MKFATILRAAGIVPKHFNNCSEISIVLYDRKDNIEPNEDVRYAYKLFVNNPASFVNFYNFLKELEKNPPESMNVKIDEFSVILFYKTTGKKAEIFLRKPKKDLLNSIN